MTTDLAKVTVDDVPNLLEKLEEAFYDIPFENSAFQTRAFVVASQQTPARAYRAIGLQMHSRIQAIKEYMYSQEMTKIDIEEKHAKIAHPDTTEYDRRRLRLEIAKIQDGARWGKKLLNDSLTDLSVLYSEFIKFPEYTRAQFEQEENQHFEARLQRQMQAGGALESLINMREDLPNLEKRIALAVKVTKALKE